jgi:hypothetical protein
VLAATAIAECGLVLLAHRPLGWVALIAGSLPATMFFFVALPVLRKERGKLARLWQDRATATLRLAAPREF